MGTLWTLGRTQLDQVTFSGESASGWQQAYFAQPVAVTPGQTYVVSYLAPAGHYSYTLAAFTTAGARPTAAVRPGQRRVHGGNGVFTYGAGSPFPTTSYNATNYFVDAIYSQTTLAAPGAPTAVTATPGNGVGDGVLDGAGQQR